MQLDAGLIPLAKPREGTQCSNWSHTTPWHLWLLVSADTGFRMPAAWLWEEAPALQHTADGTEHSLAHSSYQSTRVLTQTLQQKTQKHCPQSWGEHKENPLHFKAEPQVLQSQHWNTAVRCTLQSSTAQHCRVTAVLCTHSQPRGLGVASWEAAQPAFCV